MLLTSFFGGKKPLCFASWHYFSEKMDTKMDTKWSRKKAVYFFVDSRLHPARLIVESFAVHPAHHVS